MRARVNWSYSGRLLLCVVFLAATISTAFQSQNTYAASITTRSLTLEAGTTDGGSKAGGVVKHKFAFVIPTAASVGSIKFLYCTIASISACVTPSGLTTTSSSLSNETGATGFSLNNSTNGSPYLHRTASAVGAATSVSYELSTITNPTTENYTFFVRISTYASSDTSGSAIDTGTVAASTASQIFLSGTVPESLIFCTGATVGMTSGIPDCTTAYNTTIDFNQLFSPTDTATATSQMAASTNATNGYVITVSGTTLTSGANTIHAMTSTDTSRIGHSQFGMNLKANTSATSTTPVGAEINLPSDGVDFKGEAATGFNTVDSFTFDPATPNVVADSYNGGAGSTNAQIYTVSYIVNVTGNQTVGTYTTTLTYICTPTF